MSAMASPSEGSKSNHPSRSTAISLHQYRPLQLERPLTLFGELSVTMSSALALGPDTVLRVVTGESLLSSIRKQQPSLHDSLRKLLYVAQEKHSLSPGFKNLILSQFAKFETAFPREEIEKALSDPGYVMQGPRSPWELSLLGLQSNGKDRAGDICTRVCEWMAACDQHGFYIEDLMREGDQHGATAHLLALMESAHESWKRLNPQLAMYALAPIDISLKVLARLDWELSTVDRSLRDPTASQLVGLLRPKARPLGHWLKETCRMSGCKNLGELTKALLRANAAYRGDQISHARLKKWARSKEVVMPLGAVVPALLAVSATHSRDALLNLFGAARFLTFLCDLLRSSTVGLAPTWEEAQSQIESRYPEVYRLQAAQAFP